MKKENISIRQYKSEKKIESQRKKMTKYPLQKKKVKY